MPAKSGDAPSEEKIISIMFIQTSSHYVYSMSSFFREDKKKSVRFVNHFVTIHLHVCI